MGDEPTILIANRSRGTLLFDHALLGREGRKVRLVTKGTEAWRVAREVLPSLILFSFDLEDLKGPELCRLVRDHLSTRRVSLLLVTERNAAHEADLCMAAGCNEVIFRPLHRSELEQKVSKLLAVPPRRTVRTLTRIELPDGTPTLLGHTVNLSTTGMLLQVDRTLPPAARVTLQFFLEDSTRPIRVRSEIVRAEFTGGAPRYGVRFVDVASEQQVLIHSFVNHLPEMTA